MRGSFAIVRPLNESNGLSDDLGKSFKHSREFFVGGAADPFPDAFSRESPNLANLDPRSFRQFRGAEFTGERETGSGFLTGERHGDDRTRPFVENVVAEDKHRALAGLFMPAHGVQVGPADLPSQ